MKSNFKISLASLNQTALDITGNQNNILQVLSRVTKDTDLLVFPELSLTGYNCEDWFFSSWLLEQSLTSLDELIWSSEYLPPLMVGLPINYEQHVYNCMAVIAERRLVALIPKQQLANDGLHYEARWNKSWPSGLRSELNLDLPYLGKFTVPIGDYILDLAGVKIGIEICEDAWNIQRPALSLAQRGVDIIVNPSASHFAIGKHDIRKEIVVNSSRAANCVYAYVNLLGNEAGRTIYDGDIIIAQKGELLLEGSRFGFNNYQLLSRVLDLEAHRVSQRRNWSQPDPVPTEVIKLNTSRDNGYKKIPSFPIHQGLGLDRYDEVYQAIVVGLFDYLRKSGSQGFVVSLSGGADSAITATLAQQSLVLAYSVWGDKFWELLNLTPPENETIQSVTNLVTTVYQATVNSSETTYNTAQNLAQELGTSFHAWSVDNLVSEYNHLAQVALDTELNWSEHGISLENIQARVRAPGVWLLANLQNRLLLTTCNRSEIALGYCTMDGDTCGGLAPIAGLDKAFWSEWLLWAGERLNLPTLSTIATLKPSAELQPPEQNQTDETSLMPYEYITFIERLAIALYQEPETIARRLADHYNINLPLAISYVTKFFKLWSRNQWKRERLAPSFHLADFNLDPRSWCRFPILNKLNL